MLVKDWMSTKVVAIDVGASMIDANNLMKEHDVRILPVTRNGGLLGVLTDGDLKRASASDVTTLEIHELVFLLSKVKVGEIMTVDPVTVPFDFTLEETAEVLLQNKISSAPVVDYQGNIVGVITQHDLFQAMISLTGLSRRGVKYGLTLEDRPGSIKELTDIIRRYGGRMASILTSYDRVEEGYRRVYIRIYGIDRDRLSELTKDLKARSSKLHYLVDLRENRREIYSD